MSRPVVTPHTKHLEFDYPGTAGLDWPKSFSGPPESPAPSGLEFSMPPEDEVADLGGEGCATPTPGSPVAQYGQTLQTGSIAGNIKKRRRPEVTYDFGLVARRRAGSSIDAGWSSVAHSPCRPATLSGESSRTGTSSRHDCDQSPRARDAQGPPGRPCGGTRHRCRICNAGGMGVGTTQAAWVWVQHRWHECRSQSSGGMKRKRLIINTMPIA